MKLLIKKIFYTSLVVLSLVFILGVIIPFLGNLLSIYDITDELINRRVEIILFGIFLHFLSGVYLFKKKKFKNISLKIIILVFLFYYIGLTYFFKVYLSNKSTYFLLEISLIIGIVLGYSFLKYKNILNKFVVAILLILLLVISNNYIIPFAEQQTLYDNFDGNSNQRKISHLYLLNAKNEIVKIQNQDSKILVLDFWNNNCSICFKKFPLLIEFQKKYKKYDNLEIVAINVFKYEKEIAEGESLLRKTKNRDLINYYISEDSIEVFKIDWYPKTVVVKNNKIIFEGNLETLLLFQNKFLKN